MGGDGALKACSKNMLFLGFNQAPNNLELLQTRHSLQQRKLIEEFDPGSERTLAVCLIHASLARKPGQLGEYSGGRVRNTWLTYPPVRDNPPKGGLIPGNGNGWHHLLLKAVRRWGSGPWPIS